MVFASFAHLQCKQLNGVAVGMVAVRTHVAFTLGVPKFAIRAVILNAALAIRASGKCLGADFHGHNEARLVAVGTDELAHSTTSVMVSTGTVAVGLSVLMKAWSGMMVPSSVVSASKCVPMTAQPR